MHQQLDKFFCFLICISTKSAKFFTRKLYQTYAASAYTFMESACWQHRIGSSFVGFMVLQSFLVNNFAIFWKYSEKLEKSVWSLTNIFSHVSVCVSKSNKSVFGNLIFDNPSFSFAFQFPKSLSNQNLMNVSKCQVNFTTVQQNTILVHANIQVACFNADV